MSEPASTMKGARGVEAGHSSIYPNTILDMKTMLISQDLKVKPRSPPNVRDWVTHIGVWYNKKMRRVPSAQNELYHIFNRGTDKRQIFFNQDDYKRFIVNLILFNSKSEPIKNISRYSIEKACSKIPDDPIVKIHTFVLMPNHFHLVIEPVTVDGVAKFLHKIEMGYSRYFNILNRRDGNLFQGQYKIVHVNKDSYFKYLPIYIHLNPLDLLPAEKNWKEKGIKNKKQALAFLKNYPWSGFTDYMGIKSFPFLTKNVMNEIYPKPVDWENTLLDWLPEPNYLLNINIPS